MAEGVVAEIGVNHEGSLSKAKDLIYAAWEAGADAAKLQSYTLERYCSPKDADRYARLRSFEFSMKDHEDLFGWAAKEGGNLFSTPVTEDWVEYLAAKSGVIKVASGDSTFWPTLEAAAHSGAKILLSTGATTVLEMDEIIQNLSAVIDPTELQQRLILLHCVSSYPASPREANFGAIRFIRER